MGAYLITGLGGSGKTTLAHHLQGRGFAAYDTDGLPHVSRWEDPATGQPIPEPASPVDYNIHGWHWYEPGFSKLLASADHVFICAATSNLDAFYDYFDTVFVLRVDDNTLRHRLLTRTEHDYGKHPAELERALRLHADFAQKLVDRGAIAIDAIKPVDKVADDILKHLGL